MVGYPKYKYSGFSWIGDIPEHWEIKRTKYVAKLYNGDSLNDEQKNAYSDFSESDETIPYIASKDIDKDSCSVDYLNGTRIPKKEKNTNGRPFSKAPAGSSLLCIEGGSAGKKRCILDREVNFVNKLCCFVPKINGKFLFYYICSNSYWENFKQNLQGMIGGVTVTKLGTFPIPIPSDIEQQAITVYLDAECKKIDDLIAKEEKRVQLIEETKLSIITKVITKGFDTDKELVNSGIDWVGKIPSDWALWKTSHLFAGIGSGTTPKSGDASYYDDEGHYWLQTGDLNDGHITDTSKKVTDKAVSEKNLRFYPVNSLVIAMYGATIGKLGILDIETSTNQACCVLPPSKKVLPMFAFYHFMAAKQDLINQSAGGGQPNISQDIIRRHKIALPPTINEQQAIVDYISEKAIKFEAALRKARRLISTLKEYKQSLITEVVTGKRKVC